MKFLNKFLKKDKKAAKSESFKDNPFFDLKEGLFFDKEYSEKDFFKDCWYLENMGKNKLLTKVQIKLVSSFMMKKLKQKDRKCLTIAKETSKYIIFLRKVSQDEKLT